MSIKMSDMKTIWHKLPEQPERGRDVLEKWHYLGIHYTHFVAKNGIAEDNPFTDAWCYLDDLLALETELERKRKVLDVAVDALKSVRKCLCEMPDPSGATILRMACESATIVKNALEQITALEQGGC